MASDARHEVALPGALSVPVPALEQARDDIQLLRVLDVELRSHDQPVRPNALDDIADTYEVVCDELARLSRENAEKDADIDGLMATLRRQAERGSDLETALREIEHLKPRDQRDGPTWANDNHKSLYKATQIAAAALVGEQAAEPDEMVCDRCHRRHDVVWFAPSDVWNQVMRGGDRGAPDEFPFCCPECFIQLAEQRGVVSSGWRVSPEPVVARSSENDDTRVPWAARERAAALQERLGFAVSAGSDNGIGAYAIVDFDALDRLAAVLPADEPERERLRLAIQEMQAVALNGTASSGYTNPHLDCVARLDRIDEIATEALSAGVSSSEQTKEGQQ